MSSERAEVWAVVAAFRRPGPLRALLASLEAARPQLAGAVVVNNGGDAETDRVIAEARVPTIALRPGRNLGCGGGVAHALQRGLRETKATHFWQLDDDAIAGAGALGRLLEGLSTCGADAAVPLVTSELGRVCWFPGPLPRVMSRTLEAEVVTAERFRANFGTAARAWRWSPWTSLLMSRRAVETVGFPRDDYWFQGEDIEYTLRLSAAFHCVLIPTAECVHYASTSRSPGAYWKKCAHLQNNAYTFLRLPHGRRACRHLPGNFVRLLREEGLRPSVFAAALTALWRGAVQGRPAGVADGFRRAWLAIH
jgi:GT2 family glycosyltransferase